MSDASSPLLSTLNPLGAKTHYFDFVGSLLHFWISFILNNKTDSTQDRSTVSTLSDGTDTRSSQRSYSVQLVKTAGQDLTSYSGPVFRALKSPLLHSLNINILGLVYLYIYINTLSTSD